MKLDGNKYSIYKEGSKYFGNKNNYSEESITRLTNYFTNVINETYDDYLNIVYKNPIEGRIHFSNIMFKNFIFQDGIDFTIDTEKS